MECRDLISVSLQDVTFLPPYANLDTSKAFLMIQEIFTPDVPYSYEFVNVTIAKSETIQETIVKNLTNSMVGLLQNK